jgi:hypothetical protein
MASVKWEAGSDSTVASTTLNSLADDSKDVSSEIDNSTDLYLFDDVEWHHATLGGTPSAGAVIELYCVSIELDGTGYEDGEDGTVDPPSSNLVGVFNIRAVTAAQTHMLRQIPIPNNKYKYVVWNKTGQTLASSGNTLRRRPYRYQTG